MKTNDLSQADYELITAQVQAKAAETLARPVNTDGLIETARLIRARHLDPSDAFYANRPDRVAQSELQTRAILLRAGVTETPDTVLSVAQAQHARQWSHTELAPHVATTVHGLIAGLEKVDVTELAARADALRAETGAAAYDQLVADCGPALPPAGKASIHVLKILAAQGRYRRATEAAKPKI